MQGVHRTARVYGARRRHQRLPEHLTAVNPLPAFVAAGAAEQVVLERLEVEGGEQRVERALGLGIVGGHWASQVVEGLATLA